MLSKLAFRDKIYPFFRIVHYWFRQICISLCKEKPMTAQRKQIIVRS